MSSLFYISGQLFHSLIWMLKSKYKWVLIFYGFWIYRVSLMTGAGGGVFAVVSQLIPLFGLYFIAINYKNNIIGYAFGHTNWAIRSCLVLYILGVVSTLWAFMPSLAAFMAIQNVIMIAVLVCFFSQFKSFKETEKAFILFVLFSSFVEAVGARIETPGLFSHKLGAGSTAAMCFTYCFAELVSMNFIDENRKKRLKGSTILSLILVIIRTSGGANAAALVGVAVGLFFSKKKIYGLLLIILGIILFLYTEMIDDIILALMPGKSMEQIESSHGRTVLWEAMLSTMPGREWIGWGFACGERRATGLVYGGIPVVESHNGYIGMYCGMGIIGCFFMGFHLVVSFLTFVKKRDRVGYVGLLSAFACACTNAYSYGFFSGKGSTIIVVFFALIVLSYYYSKVPYARNNK